MKDNVLYDKKLREKNMRKIFLIVVMVLGNFTLYAGDIANFVNIGFSGDSRYYMFGQYGVSESAIYSEIYTVDVAANNFTKNGVSRKEYPLEQYMMQDGSGAFYRGLIEMSDAVRQAKIDPLLKGRFLYINVNGDPVREIDFRDFKTGLKYRINLIQEISEAAAGVESSFSLQILAEKEGSSSRAYTAGSPSVKRKNVKGYSIKKVILSPDEKGMVVVVEMSLAEKGSTSVRYMVETFKL